MGYEEGMHVIRDKDAMHQTTIVFQRKMLYLCIVVQR